LSGFLKTAVAKTDLNEAEGISPLGSSSLPETATKEKQLKAGDKGKGREEP
jgi:hypothetical protein